MKYRMLNHYIEDLLSQGELIFTKASAMDKLGKSDAAIKNSIKRQVAAKNILPLMRGIYLIIPPEYKKLRFVPPELFIDDLMKLINVPYYVCLVSAAGYFGATHQAAQSYQVMVNKRLKPISLGRTKIVFYHNKILGSSKTTRLKTDRGYLVVSTPEMIVFDMLRYVHQSGNLNFVASVFDGLSESIDIKKIKEVAQDTSLIYVQRAGYLFEYLGHQAISKALETVVKQNNPHSYFLLRPGKGTPQGHRDSKWHLIINEEIESDQ